MLCFVLASKLTHAVSYPILNTQIRAIEQEWLFKMKLHALLCLSWAARQVT